MLPASAPADWAIGDIKVTNRCGFCGDEFGVRAKHVCAKAAIDPVAGRMLTTVDLPSQPPDPHVHAPRIARTMREGVGNATRICGCTCGAEMMSTEAYADHVGWPVGAVRAVLGLVGIADDLMVHREEMLARKDLWPKIMQYLEVRR